MIDPNGTRRCFSADYKQRIVQEADGSCQQE